MNKIHTVSLEDFKKDPFVERVVASSTGPVSKRLIVRTNVIDNTTDYIVEYNDGGFIHSKIESAIETYNSK